MPHGDTSGEEAESCEGLIRTMVKGVRENVDEHDSDQEAESKLENFDGRDLKEWKRFILRNYSKTGKRAKKKKIFGIKGGCPKIHLPLLGMVRTQDPARTTCGIFSVQVARRRRAVDSINVCILF